MTVGRPSERRETEHSEGEWTFRVVSYRLGDVYHAVASNTDPGAVIARAEGASRDEAEDEVIETARRRLSRTRVVDDH